MTLKKRGISPLIATVLLIGFTVALAAVIMNWGLEFTRDTTENVGEQTNKFRLCVNDLRLEPQIDCANNKILIENNGNVNVKSVRIAIIKPTGTPALIEDGGIPALMQSEYSADLAGATSVKIQATVRTRDNKTEVQCDAQEFESNCP